MKAWGWKLTPLMKNLKNAPTMNLLMRRILHHQMTLRVNPVAHLHPSFQYSRPWFYQEDKILQELKRVLLVNLTGNNLDNAAESCVRT
jgi:hypothetical protein